MPYLIFAVIFLALLILLPAVRLDIRAVLNGFDAVAELDIIFLFLRLKRVVVFNLISFMPSIYLFGHKIGIKPKKREKKSDTPLRFLSKILRPLKLQIAVRAGLEHAAWCAFICGIIYTTAATAFAKWKPDVQVVPVFCQNRFYAEIECIMKPHFENIKSILIGREW